MKYVFELVFEPDPEMGMDDPESAQDAVEEAIRNAGIDNGARFELHLLHITETGSVP